MDMSIQSSELFDFSPIIRQRIHYQKTDSPREHWNSANKSDCDQINLPKPWHGFTIVDDNLDMNVHRRHVRIDQQTRSLHHFQCYAISDDTPTGCKMY